MPGELIHLKGTNWNPTLPVHLGVLDDNARFAFNNGQCHAFAIALAETTGGQIHWGGYQECWDHTGGPDGNQTCDEQPLPSGLCPCQVDHLLVRLGDTYLDVSAEWDHSDLIAEGYYEVVLPLHPDDLTVLCVHPNWRPPALHAARALIPAYLQWLHHGD